MSMLFLVTAKVRFTQYMSDEVDYFDDQRIIEAVDEEDARQTIETFWKDKTDEYSVYYSVENAHAARVLTSARVSSNKL